MGTKTTPDVCRLFIEEHLYMELDGLIRDLDVNPPSYIRFPVSGPNSCVLLTFNLTGRDLQGYRYEYSYKGRK